MGKILKDERVNQRRVVVNFSAGEVRALIVQEAMRIAGAERGAAAMTIKQEERGSPSYKIDEWTANVTITVELGA
ncbi:hypothetical protein [Bosea vestrisii]|uniref:Uncharacterized protein n=1 Tax=Bosea vestrisii TaxID=151416 RepID=A0ABW0H8Q9_9HYPH